MAAMTPEMVLDNFAVKLNGPRASEHQIEFEIVFTDREQAFHVFIGSGTLRHRRLDSPSGGVSSSTVHTTVQEFISLTSELTTVDQSLESGALRVDGSVEPLATFVSLLDQFDLFFSIIEP